MEQKMRRDVDSVEAALRRTSTADFGTKDDRETPEAKAFRSFLRLGAESMPAHERKALATSPDSSGGFFVSSATVTQVGKSDALEIPKLLQGASAAWVGEIESRPETDIRWGMVKIPVQECAAWIAASNRVLEDAEIDLEAEIGGQLGGAFATLETAAFVNGANPKQPSGFLTDASVATVNSGAATDVDPDALVDMLYKLPAPYRANATWVMNSTVLSTVKKMKDGNGRYLWDAGNGGIVNGQPDTVLGRPVAEMPDMPNLAAGAKAVALADWRRFYRIVDRRGTTLLRDPFTRAVTGQTLFHGSRRVGGGVVDPKAGVVMVVSA
jgi:HK97 family phage major capsid protein